RYGWDSFFHGNLVLLHQVLVLVAFPDVYVDDFVVPLEHGFHIGAMKCQVENVTVIAPVGAKDNQHSFVLSGSERQRLFDLSMGIKPGSVDHLAGGGGLLQPCGITSSGRRQPPLLTLLLP